ncbi:MAG: UMP kinase [Candidatus Bathyarchaeota archaeon]|jgi:uridylate kinase|nr:MAG: UMP kinase [Candidatus Bathyarchaeota archaeon]
MRVVIRIGGSVIASPTNISLISEYSSLLTRLKTEGFEIAAVVGGGALARKFIKIGNQLELSEEDQDWLAIYVSRLYALALSLKLGDEGIGHVPSSIKEIKEALNQGRIVVVGGLKPGMTTDTVAAHVAKQMGAKILVKATDQDGVYTKDPRKFPSTKKLFNLSYKELTTFLEKDRHKAGIHQILDPTAVKILEKENMTVKVVNGFDPQNIDDALKGKKVGTTIAE